MEIHFKIKTPNKAIKEPSYSHTIVTLFFPSYCYRNMAHLLNESKSHLEDWLPIPWKVLSSLVVLSE